VRRTGERLTYRLGRDTFGKKTGVAGALIFAALPLAVYYTQVVRHYGLLILLAALSASLFVRALRRPTPARIAWLPSARRPCCTRSIRACC
jgi:uncharacterized membrane protein